EENPPDEDDELGEGGRGRGRSYSSTAPLLCCTRPAQSQPRAGGWATASSTSPRAPPPSRPALAEPRHRRGPAGHAAARANLIAAGGCRLDDAIGGGKRVGERETSP
ncbi:unnamed protein product, partial [Urochloa humidicola]